MTWYQDGGGDGADQPAKQPPAPQQGPAGSPSAGYDVAPPMSRKATVALILAIVSYFSLGFILAIFALIVANSAQQEIDASGGTINGASRVKAARIVAWVNIALSVLAVILAVVIFATN